MSDDSNEYSYNDLQLLLTLQEDPLQTYSKIASNLGKSVKTISRWVSRLENSKLFYPVRAIFYPQLLDFELYYLILTVPNLTNVKIIENFCNNHPYTVYRSRINGATNGLYLQFRSPSNTKQMYVDIVEILKEKNLISNGIVFSQSEPSINTKFNLNYWNNDNLQWNFDWKDWESSMNERNINKVPKIRTPTFNESLFKKLDLTDIFLLRLLDENAKMKLKDMEIRLKEEKISKDSVQRISERIQFLKTNFVKDYRIYLNSKVLDIYNTLLIKVVCKEGITSKIKSQILLDPPPFTGFFTVTADGFLWFLSMPATHFSKVSSIIWKEEVENYSV
ncbi:MAG: winged helix-turn-helix transcriptional regulator, partial [Candidatus Hodarchaeales archaeon]